MTDDPAPERAKMFPIPNKDKEERAHTQQLTRVSRNFELAARNRRCLRNKRDVGARDVTKTAALLRASARRPPGTGPAPPASSSRLPRRRRRRRQLCATIVTSSPLSPPTRCTKRAKSRTHWANDRAKEDQPLETKFNPAALRGSTVSTFAVSSQRRGLRKTV